MRTTYLNLPRSPVLLAIILCGTALRFFHLGEQSIWYDEAVSLAIADRLDLWGILTNQGESSHPPLYYLLLRTWTGWVGINDFAARVPSTVAGILTIPILYQVGRVLFNRNVGLWSALFIAVFPFHVYYAQEIRMYTLLGLLTTLSLWFFWQAIKENRKAMWAGYWGCVILGFYTHYFISFVVLIYHIYLILNYRRYWHLWKPVLITDSLLLLAFLPQTVNFLSQSDEVLNAYWLGKPNPLAFFTTIYFFVVSYTVPSQLNFLGLFLTLSWLIIGLYELLRRSKLTEEARQKIYLLSLGTFGPLLIVLAISQIRPIFLERTLIICTPFLILLLARTLFGQNRRPLASYLAGFLSILIVLSLYRLYFDPTVYKPPLRQATAQVNEGFQEGDLVLHTSVGSFVPFLFYHPPANHFLLWGDPDPRKSKEAFQSFGGQITDRENFEKYQRLWLVVALDHSVDYQRDQVAWFDRHFSFIKEIEVGGILIRQYQVTK